MFRFRLWSHWAIFPAALRRAVVIATLIVVAGSALVYQTTVQSEKTPEFSRGGAFAGQLTDPRLTTEQEQEQELTIPTPTPRPAMVGRSRSSAVLTVPRDEEEELAPPEEEAEFPELARYVFEVDGFEEAAAFGSREYPEEMTTTIHRTQPTDPDVPPLKDDEVIYDLSFGTSHDERQIVAHSEDGMLFTYEAIAVSFGAVSRTSEAIYDPPILHVPLPLEEDARESGASRAINEQGEVVRTDDWTVEVLREEEIEVLGETIDTWVVRFDKESRPGTSEQMARTRTYWFDPERIMWVRWEEEFTWQQPFGPGQFSYHTEFTATLSRVEPLQTGR